MGARRQPVSPAEVDAASFLLRVEFDDELFLDGQTDVFTLGKVHHPAQELLGIQLQPRRNAAAGSRFDGLADLVVLARFLANLDHITLAGLIGGDVDLLPVHLDVSMTDDLTGLRARGGETKGVHDVVETELELAEKVLAGDAGLALGALEVET